MIEVLNLLLASFAGIVAGIVIGLVPGLGVSSTFLLLTPVLVTVSPVYSLFLFVSLLITSQYFGSITALVYGVPGELSSYPVINERPHLLGKIDQLLKHTAQGSFVASMLALVIFALLMQAGSLWVYLYNYKIFSWVLAAAVIATVMFGSKSNGKIINAILFVSGLVLATVGFNKDTGQSWGTFGILELSTGIPLAAVALGLLVVPSLAATTGGVLENFSQQSFKVVAHWGSVVRGTVLGIVGGLVPGVTYMASTQLSYFVENKLNAGSPTRPEQAVIATSSADNAGAVSSLYPLLWLGIPISLGEAMLVWLFDKQNVNLNWTTISQPINGVPLYLYLAVCFVLTNILAYLMSWPGRQLSIRLARSLLTAHSNYIIIALVLISVIMLANESYNQLVFYGSFGVACVAGMVVKQLDWMPLVMGFILQDSIHLVLLKLGVLTI